MISFIIVYIWFVVAFFPDPDRQWRSNWLRLSLEPDFIIGGKDDPYLRRWWIVPRNKWFNVYVHEILRDDNDRALHDHPWSNCSVILSGQYREVTLYPDALYLLEHSKRTLNTYGVTQCSYLRKAGSIVRRDATTPHRLELIEGKPCWTLFMSGPRRREWGFHAATGWIHWKDFTDPEDRGSVRR